MPMLPSLYVQIIRTDWTKKSRGGALAGPRNAVPLAFPIDDAQNACLSVQRIFYSESDCFQVPTIQRERIELTDDFHFEWSAFSLHWDGQCIKTRFLWSAWAVGAPRPSISSPKTTHLTIGPDEWAQLRWRGRFSDFDTGMWFYRHTCINIAHFSGKPDARIFLESHPDKQFIHLPHLR